MASEMEMIAGEEVPEAIAGSGRIGSLRKRPRPAADSPAETPKVEASSRKRPRPASKASSKESGDGEKASSRKKVVTSRSKGRSVETKKASSKAKVLVVGDEEEMPDEEAEAEAEADAAEEDAAAETGPAKSPRKRKAVPKSRADANGDCFVGAPITEAEAKKRWPARYQRKAKADDDLDDMRAIRHYLQAKVDDCLYNLNDDAYVKAGDGEDDYIGRIVELFEGVDRQLYFTAQWFYRAKDTVIKDHFGIHDERRVFFSEEKNVNLLDCLISKIKIVRVAPNIDLVTKEKTIPPCDLYYDMSYSLAYSAFAILPPENGLAGSPTSTISSESSLNDSNGDSTISSTQKTEMSLLDMYSGCGAMSTGLCLGANLSGINLVTKWAVDFNKFACESLKLNHPETEVRNEKAEDFLSLIREWEKLCQKYSLSGSGGSYEKGSYVSDDDEEVEEPAGADKGEFEVGKLVGIRYEKPNDNKQVGLQFKVRWKGYGPSEDTWEPVEGLSKCDERIEDFVKIGFQRRILPLPGTVDVICGGPPCQGISGFNRFRNTKDPLADPKNMQMVIFADIVEFLKPRYVLMENVVDILKFAQGFLGRYALSRLVALNYQARLGILAAGSFGLPQFRMRCFLWGAQPSEKLPQFPLPTHNVVVRGGGPNEFEGNLVAYNENEQPTLEEALHLVDAISDLPPVTNDECKDETVYGRPAKTDFQRFIRLTKQELVGSSTGDRSTSKGKLYDHMPLVLNTDDYQRVCRIPKRKGANFRDLPGVRVGADNIVELDPNVERVYLPSGKPLVPDYAITFVKGKSMKPFARLWWDETVPTVVTRAEPHNQAILHPEQDRVLTIRENARLQGFPDFYKLCGPVKERYIQVGNAVAVPVSRALGYSLGMVSMREGNEQHIFSLPSWFPRGRDRPSSPVVSET